MPSPTRLERLTIEINGDPIVNDASNRKPISRGPYSAYDIGDFFDGTSGARHLKSLALDILSIVETGANNSLSCYAYRRLKTLTLLETLEIRTNGNLLMDDDVIKALCTALREMTWLGTLRLEMDDSW